MAKQKQNDGAPRHRGRTHLTEADKSHMAERRVQAVQEKAAAAEALASNPQFRNPKFWTGVPVETAQAVVDAIRKGGERAKLAEIEALEAKIKALKGEQAPA
jgi:hypothetical protein